jgi:hypothetical protein
MIWRLIQLGMVVAALVVLYQNLQERVSKISSTLLSVTIHLSKGIVSEGPPLSFMPQLRFPSAWGVRSWLVKEAGEGDEL